jgi:hypothetical protein
MLEFIVLGEIPGTSFQITFSQLLLLTASMLIAYELRIVAHRKDILKTAQDFIQRISL